MSAVVQRRGIAYQEAIVETSGRSSSGCAAGATNGINIGLAADLVWHAVVVGDVLEVIRGTGGREARGCSSAYARCTDSGGRSARSRAGHHPKATNVGVRSSGVGGISRAAFHVAIASTHAVGASHVRETRASAAIAQCRGITKKEAIVEAAWGIRSTCATGIGSGVCLATDLVCYAVGIRDVFLIVSRASGREARS